MKKLSYYIRNPYKLGLLFLTRYFLWLPDALYLKIRFWLEMGFTLNLDNPKTFQEKIQWLKLYNRKPFYTKMVDKNAAKDYVASIIGQKYIIPTIGIWESPQDIDFKTLPTKFVLKTTHGGGGGDVIICRDKDQFNKEQAIEKLKRCMKGDIYRTYREWPYKNVPRRIIAEKYIETTNGEDLSDYKFFCFNGIPKFLKVDTDRYSSHHANYYDLDWNLLPFDEMPYPHTDKQIVPPQNLDEMIAIASQLSKGIPFLRVDLYNISGQILFGELTFYPASGMGSFSPKEWNITIGGMLQIADNKDIILGGVKYSFIRASYLSENNNYYSYEIVHNLSNYQLAA